MTDIVLRRDRVFFWAVAILFCLALPHLFHSSFVVSLLCQIGIMVIFSLSYNMLLGQTGLLSFGHAVYYGLGAFVAMHTLNYFGKDASPVVIALMPAAGAVAGLAAAIVLGYVTTRRAGTTFAMISLGIGELVAASSLMFSGFFGGEGGISGNRAASKANAIMGITFGPQMEMYYLIVFWGFVAVIAMFALTQTPLGRIANAVRDNPERVEFIGYNTQLVRYRMLVLSGLFAGMAGGLTALNYEIVTAETLASHTSGVVLLMAFVGGIPFFYGPIIGAALITVMQIVIGGVTKAWLLYFGLFFLFMVLWAPGGIASVFFVQQHLWRAGLFGRMVPHYLVAILPILVMMAGLIGIIEMAYAAMGEAGDAGETINILGAAVNPHDPVSWTITVVMALVGFGALRWVGNSMSVTWNKALAALHGDKDA